VLVRSGCCTLLLRLWRFGAYASPMSLLAATWTGAGATVGLFLGAVITSIFAIKAFGKQSQEVGVLQQELADQREANRMQAEVLRLQARELRESLDERQQAREQKRRDQATRVFTWVGVIQGQPTLYYVAVHNASDRPIYNVGVTVQYRRGGDSGSYTFQSEPVTALMPGITEQIPTEEGVELPWPTDPAAVSSTAYFYDAAEVSWTVTSSGKISEYQGILFRRPLA
jgi:hypothetical protein